jgi:exopolysaccharide production repressor protein
MYAPRFFVSMTCVLLVFAGVTYWMTGSLYSTFLQTIVCAVILQLGYFAGVLYLVRRETIQRRNANADAVQARRPTDSRNSDTLPAEVASRLEVTDR